MAEVLRIEVVGSGSGAEAAVRRTRESVDRDAGAMESRGRRLAESTSSSTRRAGESWSLLGRSAKAGAGQAVAASREAEGAMGRQTRAVRSATAAGEEHRRSWVKTAAGFAAGGAVIGAAYKAYGFVKSSVEDTVQLGLATKRLSALTGLDTKQASAWVETARIRNVQAVTLNRSFITLARNVEAASHGNKKAADSLNELGVSQEQVKKGDLGPILLTVADGLHKTENASHRTALAQQLFGRSAQQLLPMLAMGSKALQGQLNLVDKYGFALNKTREQQILKFAAAQRTLGLATEGLKIQLGLALIPMMTRSEERWTRLIATFNNPKLSANQKMDAFSKELGRDVDKIGVVVEKAAPHIADAFAKAAPHAAMAFVHAFTGASTWGQILTGAFLLKKLGLLGPAFRAAGVPLGGSMAGGVAAGAERAPTGRWGALGRSVGGVFAGAFIAYAAAEITDKLVGKLLSGEVDLLGAPTSAKKAELENKPLQRARKRIGETPEGEPKSRKVRRGENEGDAAWRRIDRVLNQPTQVGDTATSRFSRAIADASKGNNVEQLRKLSRLVPDALRHGASMSRTEARALEGVISGSIKRINQNQPQIARGFRRDLQQTTLAVRTGIIPQRQAFVNLTNDIDRTLAKLPVSSRKWGKQAADRMIEQAKREGVITAQEAEQMHRNVDATLKKLAKSHQTHGTDAANSLLGAVARMVGGVATNYAGLERAVGLGLGAIGTDTNKALQAFGVSAVKFVASPKGASQVGKIGGLVSSIFGGKQTGGWTGHPAERGDDDRLIAVAGGEAVLTGWHQREANDALAFSYMAGRSKHPSLGHMFSDDTRPHRSAPRYQRGGYASGGIVSAHSTAYGPPWDSLEGGGTTASGINLHGSPHLLILAAPPGVPFGNRYKMDPNPFGTNLPFSVQDRGGAIQGDHWDTYVWQGHGFANQWGDRRVRLTPAGHGPPFTLSGAVGPMGAGGAGAPTTVDRQILHGPLGTMLGVGQGALDKARAGANKKLRAASAAADASSFAGGGGLFSGKTAPPGTTMFQGMPVANWIIPELRYAQAHGWRGHITSGWRSPFEVVSGPVVAPQGHSQHNLTKYPGGAVDFTGPFGGMGPWLDFESHTRGYTGPRLIHATGFRDDGHASGTGGQRGGFVGGRIRGFQDGGYVEAYAASAPDQSHGGTAIPVTQPHHKTRHPRARRPRAPHRSSRARAHARAKPRPGSRAHPIVIGIGRPTLATIKGGHPGDWIRMKDPSSRGRSELHTRGAWVTILKAFYTKPTGAFALPTTELPGDLYDESEYETAFAEYDTPFDPNHPGEVDPATGAYQAQVDDLHALQGRERLDRRRIAAESRLYGRAQHQEATDTSLIKREDATIHRLELATHRGSKKQREAARKRLAAARARKAKLEADRRKAKQVMAGARKSLTSLYGDLGTTLGSEKTILDAPGAAAAQAGDTGAQSAADQAQNQQALIDLLRQFVQNQEDIKRLAQTETTTIQAAIAAAASGQLGGSLGMALQSPGFPGGGVRY